jgi:Transposase DDE domain
LVDKLLEKHSIQLWKLSADKQEYNRNRDMLNGSLVNGIDVSKLNESLLITKIGLFSGQKHVVLVHDGSDIRKPHSEDLECLGWVRDLNGKWIRGYSTLNSVCVNLKSKAVDLLRCTPYSSAESNFVSQEELKKYETGQIKDATRRKEIEFLLKEGLNFNYKKILFEHIQALHDAIKAAHPDMMIIHVFDRYQDDKEIFEFVHQLGDYFVIRLKKNHKSDTDQMPLHLSDMPREVEQTYHRLTHLDKEYKDVKARYEWDTWQSWSVLRVSLYQSNGQRLFKEPMLLVTNLEISGFLMAFLVFEIYLHRWKIESVFRFLKQVLGWEEFLIQDWESIRNLITLAFFIGGYFYEIQDELTADTNIIWLAELGGGKGVISRGYILKGIAKLLEMQQTQQFLQKNNIQQDAVQQVLKHFTLNLDFS